MNVVTTDIYDTWFRKLKRKDPRTAARIQMRVDRLICGNPGDAEPVGGGLSELRIHHGPGYRVYYRQQGDMLLILLCGGDKSTQTKDIEKAHEIAKEWENNGKD
ncbi:type II toxin-antitoxin system RelE/ParE family toxin [Aeromicrobium sp.]|uniref:type II toxin-antitoxin system RelE/ParE family toxin n=1 Tax=Aeromicrobium sp. TaxID=1871063 RepID=UPI0019CBE8EA|nr:type II toxin-antitoxin system RelE/ParE family toxin [Aeromicrobium sp.]MBC7632830.1 type II toxin-antitoxin system RelE/ParE family toxin [Aeromicrobium sp.]